MARHEGSLRETAGEPLGRDELEALLAAMRASDDVARSAAIACALSASEGWQDAVRELGGAFADDEPGLSGRKGELPDD